MDGVITISTHNGSQVSIGHNLRIPQIVDRENEKWRRAHPNDTEPRIDPDGVHEIWKHEDLKDVYAKLFDESVREFNDRQIKNGHPEREIRNYLNYIKANEKKDAKARHPIYEMIFMVGSTANPIPADVAKEILKEMAETFETMNPHLYVTGEYYHQDEVGQPHLHLSYVPFTDCASRGPKVQNSLKAALKQQGIEGVNKHDTAQMRWEAQMNLELEKICNRYGYQVDHYQRNQNVKHLSDEEYKLQKKIEEKKEQLAQIQSLPMGKVVVNKARLEELESLEQTYQKELQKIEIAERDLKAAQNEFVAYKVRYEELQKRQQNFENCVNEEANRKLSMMTDHALAFINQKGLWEAFVQWTQSIKEKLSQTMKW